MYVGVCWGAGVVGVAFIRCLFFLFADVQMVKPRFWNSAHVPTAISPQPPPLLLPAHTPPPHTTTPIPPTLSRSESSELVEKVLSEIADCLVDGESVKLSSFGSFVVRSKGERIGRNPKTGEEVPILPRRVMVFKPSNVLKKKINETMIGPSGDDSIPLRQ